MTSAVSERSAAEEPEPVQGEQEPRIATVPPRYSSSAGQEAIELAAHAGLKLDPWQQMVLHQGMRERADGGWSAFEVCVNVPRQNGKGAIIEARELWGLFLGGEKLILHSAHEFKTAKMAFRRIESLIQRCPDLRKRVKTFRQTVGEEAVELHTGAILRFIARSKGSGRGFTGDCNMLDEAMDLGDEAMGALMPTMSAVANPQMWYLGSAGIGAPSVQLGRLRRRALAAMESGDPDPSMAYFEWSTNPHVDECPPDCTEHDDPQNPRSWARANPALGIRITEDHVAKEHLSLGPAIFARERLGVGTYPADGADTWQVIGEDAWRALADGTSRPSDPVAFAIDMTPERSHTAIGVAGLSGEATHVEVVDHQPGTGWVVQRACDLQERWSPRCWVVDAGGPAGSLIPELEKAGLRIVTPKARQVAQACGQFFDAVTEQTIVHIDNAPLTAALAGAQQRPLGDAWAWARRGASVDISPLVAVTLAKWGLEAEPEDKPVNVMNLVW